MSNPDDLYFITCDDFIKIGRSVSVGNRMASMQSNNPQEIDCVCRLQGRGREEAIWKEAFAYLNHRGEWFWKDPAIDKAISLARQGLPWWEHIYPPFDHMDGVEDDDIGEEIVDWHIRVQLHCEPILANRT